MVKDNSGVSHGARIRVLLTDEELQIPSIDEICNKCLEWLQISKETSGRKTRFANRKTDQIYDQIMAFQVPNIKIQQISSPEVKIHSADTTVDTDSDSSSTRPITRSLRPRSRTPTIQNPQPAQQPQQQSSRQIASPCTPTHQRIRAHMKPPTSSTNGSSSVLGTALAQGHPKVSVTKIRQLLKFTDSAQKKRDEEKERQARLMQERKAKEERAEAQKKQLLEERAENAKQTREKRLNHAAELRKAREEAKAQQKLRELELKKAATLQTEVKATQPLATVLQNHHNHHHQYQHQQQQQHQKQAEEQIHKSSKPDDHVPKLNETFKKSDEVNNINISILDDTNDEAQRDKIPQTAIWTRAPHLREALISQFSKTDKDRQREVSEIFPPVQLPVELEKIFGSAKAVNTRYLYRTSSAVWSPPNKAVKRSSSMAVTPTYK